MIFIEIAKPNIFERLLIAFAQLVFWHFYLVLYIFFPGTAHRMIGYFEDQAVISYTQYLDEIKSGKVENIPAPQIAIDYYRLKKTAKLSDVIKKVRADEQGHADVNHGMADQINN
jgi:ubiquinol oxidase